MRIEDEMEMKLRRQWERPPPFAMLFWLIIGLESQNKLIKFLHENEEKPNRRREHTSGVRLLLFALFGFISITTFSTMPQCNAPNICVSVRPVRHFYSVRISIHGWRCYQNGIFVLAFVFGSRQQMCAISTSMQPHCTINHRFKLTNGRSVLL